MTEIDTAQVMKQIRWPLRLTLAGLWAERLSRAFWPLWTIAITTIASLSFGVQDLGPVEWVWAGLGLTGLAALAAAIWGWRQFRAPTRTDALIRLDATLPGRPLAALTDTQAIGTEDPASLAVWQAHKARMAARAATARAVEPDLKLSSRDPFALRYVGLTALVTALMFGSVWRAASVTGLAPGAAEAMAGPTWEGWAQPAAYTGKPSIYLNDITAETLTLPTGTRLQLRLYGTPGDLTITQSVSALIDTAAPAPVATDAPQNVTDITVAQSGVLAVEGPNGRTWQIIATPDAAPTVALTGDIGREADGRFKQGFTATDDYGVTAGSVTITLDLPALTRSHGLLADPEAIAPVVLDLPMPVTGSRTTFTQTLVDDLSEHVLSNMPVTMTFAVTDAAGNEGTSAPAALTLPGRRFFDPLAAAIIELRRDILWTRANAPRSVMILKAITNQPEGFIRNADGAKRLDEALRDLDSAAKTLTPEQRDTLAKELWDLALLFEDGDLNSALQRLQRAQDRLDEAIRNGASPEEIDELMREMQNALRDYTRELAEDQQRSPEERQTQNGQQLEMSTDQLQDMFDKLEQLMKEGRTAEAAELMEQLRQFMENMEVTQGEGQGQGQGQGGPGGQAMRDLSQTLRDQQGLSDDAFRDLQQGQNEPQPGEGEGQQGENPEGQQGEGQEGEGQQGEGQNGSQNGDQQGSLDQRQRDLRERLNRLQNGQLPGDGTAEGEEGRRALDEAGRAMEEAEDALRDGDLPGAMDRQAEAMEALRDGIRNFGEALAEEQREEGTAEQGERQGAADPNGQRDPLGREPGDSARIGSDRNMVQEDPNLRAQDLLDEIRRRSAEQTRPEPELDYLRRLLDLF